MKPIYLPSNNITQLNEIIHSINDDALIKSVLFFVAEKCIDIFPDLEKALTQFEVSVLGGVFPELIAENKRVDDGIVLIPLSFVLKVQLFDLQHGADSILDNLEKEQKYSLSSNSTVFTFVDSLSPQKDLFTESLFNYFGINASYFGGGTGSLSFKSIPSIITNEGIFFNAAVIGWMSEKIALASAHGWRAISEPLKITKAKDNKVAELDWEPAFVTYKGIVEKHSGLKFSDDNFFELAKSYPLGIAKMDAEMVVRDPFMMKRNEMHFFDSIQEGEYVKILHGDISSLLGGAEMAKSLVQKQSLNNGNALCIDCISRALFMGDLFKEELGIIEDTVPFYGVLSIGEIANTGESFLEIFNKTIAIGTW